MGKLVSVIMPAFNAEKHISESIESVIAQTYKNWELVIVDDGSTDDTGTIAKHYTARDIRIKYIYQENQKQGASRNNGIKISKGNLIAFLDSDDVWVAEKLEIQLRCLNDNEVDLVYSAGFVFFNDISEPTNTYNTISETVSGDEGVTKLLRQNFIPIPSVLVSKKALNEVGGFDTSLEIQNVEDYHLWLKLMIKGFSFYGIPDRLFYYRQHESQVTAADPYAFEKVITMLCSHLNYPKRMDFSINEAKLTWGRNWYILKATDRKSASEILDKMMKIDRLKAIGSFTRLVLNVFGFRISKKILNRLVRSDS